MSGTEREPCPWRIVDDAGGAFAFGIVGGSIWNGFGGARNAPRGQMLSQAISRVKSRAPILGGSFAVWGTFFSIFDCSIAHIRKKEDPWNAIMSGFLTGGVLAIRAGPKVAGKNALAGGVILAVIEGLNVGIQRVVMPYFERRALEAEGAIKVDLLDPPEDPMRARSRSLLGGSRGQSVLSSNTPSASPSSQPAAGGFDIDKIYDFEKNSGSEGSWGGSGGQSLSIEGGGEKSKSEEKPFWKFW